MALLYCSYLPVESCFTPPLAHVLQHVDLWRVLCLKPQALDSALFMHDDDGFSYYAEIKF